MQELNENLILQLCCDYLEDKDESIAKKLQMKFNLEPLKNDFPKLKEIISQHMNKSKSINNFKSDKTIQQKKRAQHEKSRFVANEFRNSREKQCFNCNGTGHIAADCSRELNQERFANLTCYVCNKSGHISRNCPEKVTNCYKCQKPGHIMKECRNSQASGNYRKDVSNITCYNCKETGHLLRDCPKTPTPKCFTCDELGHISRECPNKNGTRDEGCFKCGKKDHKKINCPQMVSSSNPAIDVNSSVSGSEASDDDD